MGAHYTKLYFSGNAVLKSGENSTANRCKALGVELGLRYPDQEETLEALVRGLDDALGFQRQLEGSTTPTQGVRELEDLLKKISTPLGRISNRPHLLKAKRARVNGRIRMFKITLLEKLTQDTQKIAIENRQLLDSFFYEVNDRDSTLLLWSEVGLDECGFGCAVQSLAYIRDNDVLGREAERLKKAVDHFILDLKCPGRGGTKSTGRFIAGIEMLARYFKQLCPDKRISASPDTRFYKYVHFWFNEIGEGPQEDPKRHILAFLNSPLCDLLMDHQPPLE